MKLLVQRFCNQYNTSVGIETRIIDTSLKTCIQRDKKRGEDGGTQSSLAAQEANEAVKQAIILAKENGAQGVAFYEGPGLTEEFKKVIIEAKQELN